MAQTLTIVRPVSFSGVGVHSGKKFSIQVRPVAEPSGITFYDPDGHRLKVSPKHLIKQNLGTCLENKSLKVKVTEHLLAALAARGIYHVDIFFLTRKSRALDYYEIPILTGNSQKFYEVLMKAGKKPLSENQSVLKLIHKIKVQKGSSFILALPSNGFSLEVDIDYRRKSQKLKKELMIQENFIFNDVREFSRELAWARTFGWVEDLKNARAMGLSRGASMSNAIGIKDDGTYTKKPKHKEFSRHKTLDLFGDLAVLGAPLQAKIYAYKPGHDLNAMLVKKIFDQLGKRI